MADNDILQLQDKDLFETEDLTPAEKQTAVEKYLDDYGKFTEKYRETLPEFIDSDRFQNTKEALESLKELKASVDEAIEFIEKDNSESQDTSNIESMDIESSLINTEPFDKLDKIKKVTDRLALITDKNLKQALTPYKNPHAYIQQLDESFFQMLEFDPDNGTMNIKGNLLETITLQNAKTRSNLTELDLPLLRSLYTIIYEYSDKIDTRTVRIHLPALTIHLGIYNSGDKTKAVDLLKKISAFNNVVGVLKDGSFYQLLNLSEYDKQTNSITFGSPYMNKVLRTLRESNTIENKKKGTSYINPHHSFLIHSSIMNERNKPAIEIVCILVSLLQQRGERKPPKNSLTADNVEKIMKNAIRDEFNNEKEKSEHTEQVITTAHKKISELIKEIPLIEEALIKPIIDKKTNMPKPKVAKDKNIVLQRAFSRAYELLKEKTDVYKYYNNLKIPEIIPTVTTLDQVLEISHTGINKDYKKA